MQKKRNQLQRCKSKVTFLAYLDTHPWLQNETYYWTGDRKIKCQVCDKIIPTASKMKQHSKGIKHKKKLVDHYKNRLSSLMYHADILSNEIESNHADILSNEIESIQNHMTVDNVEIDIETIEDNMMRKTHLKVFDVAEDCLNGIVNNVSEVHSALDVLNEDEEIDKVRVDKAEAKQMQEMKSSLSVPIDLFALGEGENMKDFVNAFELKLRKMWNHANAWKLMYS